MGKKNRRSDKSSPTDSSDMENNPFAGLNLPDLPQVEQTEEEAATASQTTETLLMRVEKKGRRGKTVTVIDGFKRDEEKVASLLKRALGIGGSHFEGVVELQGDCREKAAALLRKDGYRVKGI